MSVELRVGKANEYQNAIMKKFHNNATGLLEIIGDYKVNFELQNAITRIYEAIFWFNTSIMNCSAQPIEKKESNSETIN